MYGRNLLCPHGARLAAAALLAAGAALQPVRAQSTFNCEFRAAGTLAISFGNLDPSIASNAVATMTVATLNSDQVGNCVTPVQTMSLSADNGMNFSGSTRRLRKGATPNYIPYSLSATAGAWSGTGPWTMAKPGLGRWEVVPTLTATILGVDYQDVDAGTYTDTIVLTVSP